MVVAVCCVCVFVGRQAPYDVHLTLSTSRTYDFTVTFTSGHVVSKAGRASFGGVAVLTSGPLVLGDIPGYVVRANIVLDARRG